ncbi:amy [Symbiodinium natans]|uniref:alpha-amylase n=1 Tax=Symbiodinium natans TaxID=878477 RepID=A0A812L8W7_9DINO|nr:amy [Symbiodinium natans]
MKRVAVPGLVLARAASLVEEGRPKLPWECTESNADFAQFQECANYLGPNGFDAVQVSPVTEHILGSEWFTKYQPIGFGLNSRSGSEGQFKEMVAKCRAAGVQVIVDVILNHVAAPCQAAIEAGGAVVMPCKGWAGSPYGNRRINSQDGWKGPELFHNRQAIDGNLLGNCPVEEPSFTCPQSDPPGDCTQCDFKGLPDWNTGLQPTRDILVKHLTELHDLGVTMLRLDAASYVSTEDLAAIINQLPWDLVYQEWWGGVPLEERSVAVGHYRDQKYGLKITNALGVGDAKYMPELLNISHGIDGIPPERAVYPLTFHDQRTFEADRFVPTFKNGLEFHQQQKFMLAWPEAVGVRLFGGYTFTDMDAGPPGNCGNGRCQPFPVYMFNDAEPRCMPTPTTSPLATDYEGWVCEHRWEGIAGLVGFRKACRGLPVTQTWSESSIPSVGLGRFAFRAGPDCFVALVRGGPTTGATSALGGSQA